MKGGAFVVVAGLGAVGLGYSLESYKGLAQRSQLLALSMTVCLLSLVGIPPFAVFEDLVKPWQDMSRRFLAEVPQSNEKSLLEKVPVAFANELITTDKN